MVAAGWIPAQGECVKFDTVSISGHSHTDQSVGSCVHNMLFCVHAKYLTYIQINEIETAAPVDAGPPRAQLPPSLAARLFAAPSPETYRGRAKDPRSRLIRTYP
jgi:hypothetical protein